MYIMLYFKCKSFINNAVQIGMVKTMDREKQRYVVTLNKYAYKTLGLTKEIIKRELGMNYSYSDLVLVSMILVNEELFIHQNPRVIQLLDQAKNLRLGYTRLVGQLFDEQKLDEMVVEWVGESLPEGIFEKYRDEFLKELKEEKK